MKFSPFATRQRRGYVRDASERDLAVHIETALRGIIICEKWPKSGLDVIITVLEGEEDGFTAEAFNKATQEYGRSEGWGIMSILSGCITVASAAIADAGVDCTDVVTGGYAAMVRHSAMESIGQHSIPLTDRPQPDGPAIIVKDPCPVEHEEIIAACVVGYSQSRDEITEIWIKGGVIDHFSHENSDGAVFDALMDQAVEAAMAARLVLVEAVKESTEIKMRKSKPGQL